MAEAFATVPIIVDTRLQASMAERLVCAPAWINQVTTMSDNHVYSGVDPRHTKAEPDAHGQAALLLAESILHALVDSATLTNPEAIEIVDAAAQIKVEVATAAGESKGRMNESLELLARMSASFTTDEAAAPRIPLLRALETP